MLYSEVPRTLVYKDIEVISDVLGSSSKPTIEREFYNRLVNRPFMKDVSNAYRCVLTVFNNAFYISTLIIFDDGSSLSTNIYMNKAAEGVDDVELKPHIVAATMALVYNWLGIYVHENDLASFESKDIPLLKKNISKYFEEENSDVTSEGKKDFNSLVIVDSALNKGLDDSFFVLRDMKDIVNSTDIPIQDVVKGIGYILECYGAYFNNNSERRDFMSRILERIDDEKMLVDDTQLLNSAKKKIKSEWKRLKYAPEDEAPSYLSLDNLKKVPDSWDGTQEAYIQDGPATSENSATIQEEIQQATAAEEEKWDNRYDGFLKKNLNVQAIFKALQNINSPSLPKSERGYWWTFYKVLIEINWIRGRKGDQKILLQWANHHFDLGWNWSKSDSFKFGEVPNNEIIKHKHTSEWKNSSKRVDYYGELADMMIEAFQIFTEKGCNKDKQAFLQPRAQFINKGQNTFPRR